MYAIGDGVGNTTHIATIRFKGDCQSPPRTFIMPTKVVNIRREPYEEYIGRAGHGQDGYFGNPHSIGYCRVCKKNHNRGQSIEAFREDFYNRVAMDKQFRRRVLELRGKTLGCFCKPLKCHGDVYVEWIKCIPEE